MIPTSAGVLFLKDGAVFMGHATETPHWDIPKGGVDKGESFINAAVRETFEETGFVVDPSDLQFMGHLDYTNKKKLALFLYCGKVYPEADKAVCDSLFMSHGRMIPEMDGFKYVPIHEIPAHARKTMGKLLTDILS